MDGIDLITNSEVGLDGQSAPDDVGENSNSSSNEGNKDGDSELSDLPDLNHQGHMDNRSATGSRNFSRNSNMRISSRYCQFETPADESRGTFPDDFDEEMFINTGQLVQGKREPQQFDEELEPIQHDNHALNLDTADHSESSDIEDLFPNPSNSTSSKQDTVSSATLTHNSSVRCDSRRYPRTPTSSRNSCDPDSRVLLDSFNSVNSCENSHQTVEDLKKHGSTEERTVNDTSPNSRILPEECNQEDFDKHSSTCKTREKESQVFSSSLTHIRKRKWVSEGNSPSKKIVSEDSDIFHRSPKELGEIGQDDICPNPPSPSVTLCDTNPVISEWLNTFMNWNPIERLKAINHLINASEPSEVRHMMRVIEPQFQRDFISLLPKELALYVLSFLEPKDLLQAAQTCRYWRILCDDSLLWKEKCREAGIGPFSAMAQRIHNRRGRGTPIGFHGGNRIICPGGNETTCNSTCEPWKAAFLRQHNVEMNWRFQPIRPAKTLKGHDDHVITCLQFSGNRVVSGSDDNTLKVWSATTGKCLRTLIGHTGGVWSSQMSGTTIVSGSTDRTLRVWNADTGACIHTLYGHTSTVRCMHLYERKVVSGSRDATLRVWSVDSGECLHVLVGHLAAVRCVQYNGKIVVSGAYDFMVRVWDAEREECLHQLSGHTNRVYSLQFDGIHVVSGSLDTSIRVWDVQTGACKHTLMGHQSLTSGMELRDNLLVSGNADSTVKIWDINTGQCLLTLSGPNKHLSAVTCLQLINKFVITSSDDGTVKLWDISTGEFVRNLVSLSSGGSGGVVWRIRASETKLVCAVGSRNGTEETKLLVLDFDVESAKLEEKDTNNALSPSKCA